METMLLVHIAGGAIGIASGFVALYARKGAKVHLRSGKVFVYAMLLMSGSAAVMAALRDQKLNLMMGMLAFYLVTTAWLTVRPVAAHWIRWQDAGALLFALGVGAYGITLGTEAANSPGGMIDGMPPTIAFVFATVALLGASGDARVLARGVQGQRRIARHLWRMCLALFIASGSFFLGQADEIPEPIRITPLLAIPAFLPLLAMLYWLWRVRPRRRAQRIAGIPASQTPAIEHSLSR